MRTWLSFCLKALLSAGLIWFLLSRIDLAEAWARLRGADPWTVALAVVLFAVQVGLNTGRWQAVLAALDARLAFRRAFSMMYIGVFFNQTLPSAVGGDAVRMFLAYREGMGLGAAVNGVMLERLATVFGLILVVVGCQPVLAARLVEPLPGQWVFPLLLALALGGIGVLCVLDRLPVALRRWRVVRGAGQLAADTRRVFLRPAGALPTLAWALAGHVNLCVAVWILGLALGLGDSFSFLAALVLVPAVLLVMTLPISIAGWGVREGAMVAALGLVGVAAEDALVLSLLMGLCLVVVSLPGGLFWLSGGGRAKTSEAARIRDVTSPPDQAG